MPIIVRIRFCIRICKAQGHTEEENKNYCNASRRHVNDRKSVVLTSEEANDTLFLIRQFLIV